MDTVKKGLRSIAKFLGLNRNSKYVNHYLMEANVRSMIYMTAVIVILEVWLIIYQHVKADGLIYLYNLPVDDPKHYDPGFDAFFLFCSNFVLFLLVGANLFVFGLTYRMKDTKKRLIINLVFSVLAFTWSWFIFYEAKLGTLIWDAPEVAIKSNSLKSGLAVTLYIVAMFISISVAAESVVVLIRKKTSSYFTMAIIVLFALMCLAFGFKISYGDYISSKPKQMICFFTMAIYVVCLLIWRPFISVLMNVAIFVGFWQLLSNVPLRESTAAVFTLKDGDFVNYTTFVISLTMVAISIYHQRLNEATKDEELEFLADYDELTGLHNASYFARTVDELLKVPGVCEKNIILFINVSNFKTINDQHGFVAGNVFLKEVGKLVDESFPKSVTCRQGVDHYIVFTPFDGFDEIIKNLNEKVKELDKEIVPEIKVGGYRPKASEDSRHAADKARYACHTIGQNLTVHYREYDDKMDQGYHLMQYVIHNIDKAIEQGWIRPFYQPVVWSKDKKLCGVEALARWVDPERGLLPPYAFIGTLEQTKLIHKLDTCIVERVCQDIRNCLDNNLPLVSVSLNFSRIDFEVMDVVEVLEEIVAKYRIPKELLHVEITESALSDSESVLAKSVRALKERGYRLWLDDFGSGYSSLNVLKDYDFDVLKIDMKFLSGFSTRPKAKPLIAAVVAMAEKLGMHTVCEGVETDEQREFLKTAECERLQGYLFGKPIPFEDLQDRINKGEFTVSDTLS